VTKEGEIVPGNMQELIVSNNPKCSDRLLFMPIVVEHRVDTSSPLFHLIDSSYLKYLKDPSLPPIEPKFKTSSFEIVVILEGTVESTGQSTQARTSYLPMEIKWNHVFEPLIVETPKTRKATLDFSKFNTVKHVDLLKELKTKRVLSYLNMNKTLTTDEETSSKKTAEECFTNDHEESVHNTLKSEASSASSVARNCFETTSVSRKSRDVLSRPGDDSEWNDLSLNETATEMSKSLNKGKRVKMIRVYARRASVAIPGFSVNKKKNVLPV
jgi:hypothetical protein